MPANNPSQVGNGFNLPVPLSNQRSQAPADVHLAPVANDDRLRASRDQSHQSQSSPVVELDSIPARGAGQSVESNSMGSFLQGNIEMALRQASGDENVFQLSPTIGVSEPSLNWPAGQTHLATTHQSFVKPNGDHHQQIEPMKITPSDTSVTTTEQSNNIAQNEQSSSSSSSSLVPQVAGTNLLERSQKEQNLDKTDKSSLVGKSNKDEQQTFNRSSVISSPAWDGQQVSNQIFYEGPATAPPTSPADNYYFSSSSSSGRQPEESERGSNSWW